MARPRSALLGSLSGGLALLPFIEPGLGKDALCGQILSSVEAESRAEKPAE